VGMPPPNSKGMMDIKLKLDEALVDSKKHTCQGVFLRCSVSEYLSNGILTYKETYRILKRKSCSQCADAFEDDFSSCGDFSTYEFPEHPEHGAIYEAIFVPGPRDWETGYIEDWTWKFELENDAG